MYELIPKPQQIPEELLSNGVVTDVSKRFEFCLEMISKTKILYINSANMCKL